MVGITFMVFITFMGDTTVDWKDIHQAALTLTQLLNFNSVKHARKCKECTGVT